MDIDFYISTDKSLLDLNFIHRYITKISYWGKGRTLDETKKTIENSHCFGVYDKANVQIGFARVVTDYTFFGYLADVFVDGNHRGKSLGKSLMNFMLKDETVKNLQTLSLKTKDAHGFYQKYGFKKVGDSPLWMSMDRQKLD